MSNADKSSKFVMLDGLRGFAALAVMIFHFHFKPELSGGWNPFQAGALAVDFFFVLSGFVIAHAYERRFSTGMSTGQFTGARLIRLAPMYIFGTALTIACESALRWKHYYLHPNPPQVFITDALLGLLGIPILKLSMPYYPFNTPAWSLIFELIGNVVYRLFFKYLSTLVVGGLVFLSYLATYIRFQTVDNPVGIAYLAPDLVRITYGFFAGVLVYRIWSASSFRPAAPAWLLVVALLLFLVDKRATHLVVALFPVLVYFGACAQFTPRMGRWFAILGELSFGIYMIHFAIIRVAVVMVDRFHGASAPDWWPFAALATTLGVIFLAFVSYHIYDVPLRSRLTRLLRRPSKLSVEQGLTRTAAEPLAGGRS
jgi:peptidoglycan/LPS O-acetylase OafA/YrhL